MENMGSDMEDELILRKTGISQKFTDIKNQSMEER